MTWIRQWFLSCDPKAQSPKDDINKLDFIAVKNFCASKDIIQKVKRIGENIYKS